MSSLTQAPDGNLDIGTSGVQNVTVSNSLIYDATGEGKNSLVAYGPQCITYVRNLLRGTQRNPQLRYDDNGGTSPGLTMDLVNNLIAPRGSGTFMRWGIKANVDRNYFVARSADPTNTLTISGPNAAAYVAGNVSSLPAYDPNAPSNYARQGGTVTMAAPFPAPPVSATDALSAACAILDTAGPQHRDAADLALIAEVRALVPACP